MSQSDLKLLRKQLRNVVQESVVNEALLKELQDKLTKHVDEKFLELSKRIFKTLQTVDERSKDINNFILRTQTKIGPTAPKKESDEQKA